MSNIVVVGTQWGDEGKGKIVDLFAEKFDIVVRYQGGHNAGHTVIIQNRKYVFHSIPSGILHPDKVCVIGNGAVIDPAAFIEELEMLEEFEVQGRLFVSNRAHLIMPYHCAVETAEEERLADQRIGTTSRGIGPCYEDKLGRRGIRIGDLFSPDIFKIKLLNNIELKNLILTKVYGCEPLEVEEIFTNYMKLAPQILPFVTDTAEYLNRSVNKGMRILFEGAQGTHLDVDHGTYPFVTSSSSTAGGACTGTGIGPSRISGIVGIAKAYTTRVGEGPFPTELMNDVGLYIRDKGKEFGASTGRPRRCGWFDAVVTRYGCLINHVDTIVITKLDVLDNLSEIQVCVGYEYKGENLDYFPIEATILGSVHPIYETFQGWETETSKINKYDDLPEEAKRYLNRLSELIQTDISIISIGPDRTETVILGESPHLMKLFPN